MLLVGFLLVLWPAHLTAFPFSFSSFLSLAAVAGLDMRGSSWPLLEVFCLDLGWWFSVWDFEPGFSCFLFIGLLVLVGVTGSQWPGRYIVLFGEMGAVVGRVADSCGGGGAGGVVLDRLMRWGYDSEI